METPVSGTPRLLLRLEGLALLAASLVGYHAIDASWPRFALLLLVPDASIVAYVVGPRAGAIAYNAVHTYFGPAGLAALAYLGVFPRSHIDRRRLPRRACPRRCLSR